MNTLITTSRKNYHQQLLSDGVLTVDSKGIPSNADSSSKLSVLIAQGIAEQISVNVQGKAVGQTSGAKFEQINMEFLKSTFPLLSDLRPGKWHVEKLGNRSSLKISGFSQYEHLSYLDEMIRKDARLAASMESDYIVSPDIVVVTGEPLPSRIASLALGTGDIDCVYHFALYELMNAVQSAEAEDALEMMNILVDGKRLKDISDLPLDLTV